MMLLMDLMALLFRASLPQSNDIAGQQTASLECGAKGVCTEYVDANNDGIGVTVAPACTCICI
jgi:hypothetical protein